MLNVFIWSLVTPWGLLVLSLHSIHLVRHSSVLPIISSKHFLGFSQSSCFQSRWVQLLPSSSLFRLFGLFSLLFVKSGAEIIHVQPFSSKHRCWILWADIWVLLWLYPINFNVWFHFYLTQCVFYNFSCCFCLWWKWDLYCLVIWSFSCYLLIGFYSDGQRGSLSGFIYSTCITAYCMMQDIANPLWINGFVGTWKGCVFWCYQQ